jgi:transcriptional regulator with XRE-family HTH domain
MPKNELLIKYIRSAMYEKGYKTIKDLCKGIGISQTYYDYIKNSKRKPSEHFTVELSKALSLNESEARRLYNIVGYTRNDVPKDIKDRIVLSYSEEGQSELVEHIRRELENGREKTCSYKGWPSCGGTT